MLTIEQAMQRIRDHATPLVTEKVLLRQAVGRVLARDVTSDVDSPPHDKSVMDGFAVRSPDIQMGVTLDVTETIVAGALPTKSVGEGQAARIMTGAPLPIGADAVVMIEQTEFDEPASRVKVNLAQVPAGKHIMRRATSLEKDTVVFAKGHRIRATDIGLLSECGAHEVVVGGRPTMACLPTGDELVDAAQVPAAGQIRNSNGPMLIAMANAIGLHVLDLGIGRDSPAELRQKMEQGLNNDMFVLSGGVSAGTRDLVPGILNDLGVTQVFHRVLIKPGKPIWYGVLDHPDGNRTHVFGLPGNPVSSMVGFHLFVRHAIRLAEGDPVVEPTSVLARLSDEHETRGNRPTYWPGQWIETDSVERAIRPLIWHGSSDLRALGKADALIYFSAESTRHPAGTTVRVFPL